MTLSSTATKVSYDGDGSTTVFAIDFVFWDADDLRVIHRASDGTETVWVKGTHYAVTGGAGAGGTLTVKTAPTDFTPVAGESLLIKDSQAETQEDSFPLSGAFPSTVVEQRLDKLTRLIQIHSEEIARSILLPETASVSGLTIPEPGAGELVRYNPAGTALETVKAGDLDLGVDTLLTGLATNDVLRWDGAQSAWVNLKPGATGLALLQDGTAAAARAELGLGSAALLDTGLAAGNVPVMNATGYPPADGSLIGNVPLPRGYIDGLILANGVADADHDIDIAPGAARDDGNAANLELAAALTKQIDASWAEGSNAGGLDGTESVAGTPDADTWYHVWLIRNSTNGTVDALFSESATAPTMPTGYDQKRRIGAVLTDESGNVEAFKQVGDEFLWISPPLDYNANAGTTNAVLAAISTPLGIKATALLIAMTTGSGGPFIYISSPDVTDEVPSNSRFTIAPAVAIVNDIVIRTNVSSQVRFRSTSGTAAVRIMTRGWIDPRGQNA